MKVIKRIFIIGLKYFEIIINKYVMEFFKWYYFKMTFSGGSLRKNYLMDIDEKYRYLSLLAP